MPVPAEDERFARLFDRLFDRLFADDLSDIAGADASITLPVSQRLLNDLITAALPTSAPVRELEVTPLDGDRFLVGGRLRSFALLPALKLNLAIDQQPVFPQSPVLVLRLEGSRFMSLAARALRMVALPPWLHTEQDRFHVDLRALAGQYRLDRYLKYIDELRVHSMAGALVLWVRCRVR